MTPAEEIADLRGRLADETRRADSADSIKSAEKLILLQEIEAHTRTRSENTELRKIVSDIVAALDSGGSCAPDASIEFMRAVPAEVRLVIGKLRDAKRSAGR